MNIPLESQDISLWIYIILEQLSSSYTLDSLRYCIYKLEIITKPNQTRVAKVTANLMLVQNMNKTERYGYS